MVTQNSCLYDMNNIKEMFISVHQYPQFHF
jgi:hypothetical protein